MKEKLILVTLSEDQIKKAKEVNGARKQITHALLCGSSGQIFGTEKHCEKYYSAWSKIFPNVFSEAFKTNNHEITDYSSIFDLVSILIEKNDKEQKQVSATSATPKTTKPKKKGLFSKLFGG
jgi:hypothetical protein